MTSKLIKHHDCADTNSITGSSLTFYHCLVARFCASFSDAALLRCIFVGTEKLETHTHRHMLLGAINYASLHRASVRGFLTITL